MRCCHLPNFNALSLLIYSILYFIRSVLYYLTIIIGCISSAVPCIHYDVNRKQAVIGSRCSRTFCIYYYVTSSSFLLLEEPLAEAAEPRTQCTEPRAAPSLSLAYIRWRFSRRKLCRHRASEDRLLRENHEDVSTRNLWRSYNDRQKVRWRAYRDHQTEGFGHQIYRSSTQKVSYFILFYFKLFLTVSLFLHVSIDVFVCPTNYAAFDSML